MGARLSAYAASRVRRCNVTKRDKLTADRGHIKVRVIDFDLEGGDVALVEGLKTITAALSRSNGATRSSLKAVNGSTAVTQLSHRADADDTFDTDVDSSEENDDATAVIAAPRRKSAAVKRPEKLKVIPVDFDAAEIKLEDFIAELKLTSVMSKFTAVSAWLKEYLKTSAVTVDHMNTAFKRLGWTDMPKYPSTTFNDLKNKKAYQWFDSTASSGEFAINHIGVQKVSDWRKGGA